MRRVNFVLGLVDHWMVSFHSRHNVGIYQRLILHIHALKNRPIIEWLLTEFVGLVDVWGILFIVVYDLRIGLVLILKSLI